MPFPLHKAPSGLLELFRLRTLGSQPPNFGDQVTPVTDVTEFYSADLKLVSTFTSSVGAITGAGLLETGVLTGPVRLHSIAAVLSVAAAATNVTLECGIRTPAAINCPLAQTSGVPALAIAQRCVVVTPVRGLILPGGTTLYGLAQGAGGGATCDLQLVLLIDNITGAI